MFGTMLPLISIGVAARQTPAFPMTGFRPGGRAASHLLEVSTVSPSCPTMARDFGWTGKSSLTNGTIARWNLTLSISTCQKANMR
jgi:hypothetical protein